MTGAGRVEIRRLDGAEDDLRSFVEITNAVTPE